MKVIVTDHHLPNDTLPEAHAIINPNLKSCKFGSKFLSGSGVAFYLMLALRDFLIKHDWFKVNKIKIPKLAEFLDLVALGTIADLAPLDLNNRIIAARIQEYFYRPTIAFTQIKNNLLKGSVRSIKEINIRDILDELNKLHPKLIVSFGGHKAAAGLIIHNYKLNEFRIFFSKLVKSKLKNPFLQKVIWSDGELNSNECIVETATLFLSSAPWGNQFSYPVFDGKFRILKQLLIGKCHLKLKIQSISGGPILNGIYFNCDVEKWPNNQVEIILITYKLNIYRTIYKPILQLIITYLLPLKFIKK
uniref:Single-stranded-DNA-specific exonuclease RecJ n=1 Tax=Glossina palpalis gambiensis TaxID=67801 RepID=A0A1B0C6F4_9MUSC